MIIAPTPCYFLLKAEGDAAAQLVAELSPGTATDIDSVILVSSDFDSDISAVNSMTRSIQHIQDCTQLPATSLTTKEQYNPLYLPGNMEVLDEMLNLDARTDNIRFVGMNGNPYTLKIVEVLNDGDPLITAKLEYRPFDIPAYSDIVTARAAALN